MTRPARVGERRPAPPSAHDVARLAGVSQAAVSRAFSLGASISGATREKVLNAARELGYRPNLLARSLITGRSGIVGVIIGSPRNPFFLEALDALSEQLARADLHLQVFTARADSNADEMVESLLRFRVECLLLMSASVSTALAERCRREGIRVIFYNRRARAVESFPSVTGANDLGAGLIADHLVAQGYRRPAFIAGSEGTSTSMEREAGFARRLAAHGVPLVAKANGHYDGRRAMVAARELLAEHPRPDAIFCANDMMAMGTIEVARFEFGLEVGRELGVAGFDDIEGASWRSFDLTTYSQPNDAMIAEVVRLIQQPRDLLDSPDIPESLHITDSPHIVVPGELKPRASTRRS